MLVSVLMNSRGTVEPFIINHDSERFNNNNYNNYYNSNNNLTLLLLLLLRWNKFLKSTGREHLAVVPTNKLKNNNKNNENNNNNNNNNNIPKKVNELSKLEISKLALAVAERLNHNYMKAIITTKIIELEKKESIIIV